MSKATGLFKATALAAFASAVTGVVPSAHAIVSELQNRGFETTATGSLNDDGGTDHWSSYGDADLRMTVTDTLAHSGTKSITNTQKFPSGFTNLYQFGVAETTAELKGRTIAWSFWVYYDPTVLGNDAAVDNFGYQFDTRNTFNEYNTVQNGSVAASSLTPNTWTRFSGYFRSDPAVVLPNGDANRVSAVINGPTGTFNWDDFASGAVLDGDADLDGDVDFNDFLILQTNYNAADTTFVQGNFNYDGFTDFNDFLVLQTNFGQSTTGDVFVSDEQLAAVKAFGTTVPEPTSLATLTLGGLLLGRRRGRATA